VSGAIARAFDARDKATSAQEATFAALNIPTAADIERLTRRVRSVSQRLEGIEDGIDRLDERLTTLAAGAGIDQRLDANRRPAHRADPRARGAARGTAGSHGARAPRARSA